MDESEDVDKLNQFHFGAGCDSPPQCIPLLFTEPVHSGHTMPATHRPWMLQAARRAATGHPSTNHLILEMVPPPVATGVCRHASGVFPEYTSSTFGLGCDDEVMLDFFHVYEAGYAHLKRCSDAVLLDLCYTGLEDLVLGRPCITHYTL